VSQAGPLSGTGGSLPPDVATSYVTDSGTAVPALNVLNINGGADITTSGSGDTVLITFTGAASGVSSINATSPLTANGVSGTPETGTVTIAISGSTGVSSVTGTANQITASPTTGAVTLSTPVTFIAPGTITATTSTTSPSFITEGTSSGNVTIESASGTYNFILPTTSGTSGYFLTSAAGGTLTWTEPGSGDISITGDTGGALTSNSFTFTASGIGLSFGGSGSTETLSGTLKLANGGTSASLSASDGGIFYSTASAGAILAGTATANQALLSGSSTTPAWSTATYPATTTINQILYSSSNNVIAGVTAGNYGVLISSSSGVPSWLANGTTGQLLTATTSGTPSWENQAASSITITGDIGGSLTGNSFTFTASGIGLSFGGSGSTETLSGTLKLANGGTNAGLTASNGGIFYSTASAGAILAGTSTANQVILSGSSTTPTWSTATYPSTTTANQILYSSSTNTVSGLITAASGVLVTSAGSVPSISSTLPSGLTTTQLTISGTPSANNDATNVLYVQNALATVNPSTSVYAATIVNIPGTYTSVGSGIGDTFLTTATGTFTLDGTTPPLLSRILFKNQTTTFQNGVYNLTTNGTGITGSLFTRSLDYDQPSDINSTGVIAVVNGTVNQLTGWLLNVTVVTVGVSPITYVQYNAAPITTTQYDVLVGGASNTVVSVGPGSAGQALLSGGNAANPAYSTPTYPSASGSAGTILRSDGTNNVYTTATFPNTTTINQLLYSSSANTIAGLSTANQGVLTTGTGGVPVITALATNGQLIIGSTAGAPAAATLTAGLGVSIANGSNSITIASTGGGFNWTDATNASYTVSAQNGYIADRSSLVTFTLPTNNALGDTINIVGKGSGGWTIVYTTGQFIQFGSSATTTTTGNLASSNQFDCCELVCTTASASAPIFSVVTSIGNLQVT